jgi:hypothetical protein
MWDHTQGSEKVLCVVASLVDPRGLTDEWKVPWSSKDFVDESALRWRVPQLKRGDGEDTDPRPIASSGDDEAERRAAAADGANLA